MVSIKRKYQFGRSMVEMLGVLAIVGVMSVGGIAGYSQAMLKNKINKTLQQVSYISSRVQMVYGSKNKYHYDGLNNNVAIKLGLIPDEMVKNAATGKIEDAFGGDVYVIGEHSSFRIYFRGIPQKAMVELATQNYKVGFDRFVNLTINPAYID